MNKGRNGSSFYTSVDIFGGGDTEYNQGLASRGEDEKTAEKTGLVKPIIPGEKKKSRAKRSRNYIPVILITAIVIIAFVLFLKSPVFTIEYIQIDGNHILSDQEILKISEISKGQNMFEKSAGKVKSNLKDNPYIGNVKITRKIPDTYAIKVEEVLPSAAILYGENKYIILDSNGIVIDCADSNMTATILNDVTVKKYKVGSEPKIKGACNMSKLLAMLNAINAEDLYFKQIDFIDAETVKGYITDTLTCQGDYENISLYAKELKRALYDINEKGYDSGDIYISESGYASFNPK